MALELPTQTSHALIDGYIRRNHSGEPIPNDLVLIIIKHTPGHRRGFPRVPGSFEYRGYLDCFEYTPKKASYFKRRYCVLHDNMLFMARDSDANYVKGRIMLGRYNLQSDEDQLKDLKFSLICSSKRRSTFTFRAYTTEAFLQWKEHIAQVEHLKIKDIYRFKYSLTRGSERKDLKVVASTNRRTGQKCVVKIVDKRFVAARTEIRTLRQLDNENIVQLYDIWETRKYFYIVMEHCRSGKLFDYLVEFDDYKMEDLCHFMHQIASGIKYMHSMGIAYRDLKPHNILCVLQNSRPKVKIADWGLNKVVDDEQKSKYEPNDYVLKYKRQHIAPEIRNGNGMKEYEWSDYTADFWSLGCIMYTLLSGSPAFEVDVAEAFESFDFNGDCEHANQDTMTVIAGFLDKDPSKRLSAHSVLRLSTFGNGKDAATSTSWRQSRIDFRNHVFQCKMRNAMVPTNVAE